MQIQDKFRDLYAFKSAIGLRVTLDLSENIYLSRISKDGTLIHVEDNKIFSSTGDVKEYLTALKNIPISLYVSGKGILVKSVSTLDPEKTELSEVEIQQILPTFTKEDFYSVQFKGASDIWISIVKKNLVDNLLLSFSELGIHPVQLFIGPFVLSHILSQLNVYSQTYIFNGVQIEIDENRQWLSYKTGEEYQASFKTKVGNKAIAQEFLPSYAAAFTTLMQDYLPELAINHTEINFQFSEAKEKIKFKVNGLVVLGFIFLSLLVSTILFSQYYQENEELQSSLTSQSLSDKQLQDIVTETKIKEKALQDMGWNGGISKAWLLDQIGQSIDKHPAISLTAISINPINGQKRMSSEKANEDNRNKIQLEGRVQSLESLNKWVMGLNQLKWVKLVSISKFGPSNEYNNKDHVFRLAITLDYELE